MLGKIKIIKVVNTKDLNACDRGKVKSALLLSREVAGDGCGFSLVDKTCVDFAGAVVETRGETGTIIVGEVEGLMVDLILLVDVALLVVEDGDIGAFTPNPVPKELGICLLGQEY